MEGSNYIPRSKAHWEAISQDFSSVLTHVFWSFVKTRKLVLLVKPMVNLPVKGSRALYRGVRKRIKRIDKREDP